MDAEAYADMLPWLVFFVVDRRAGLSVSWAGGCAAIVAAALVAWSYYRGRRAPLVRVAVVVFGALFLSGVASAWWDDQIGPTRVAAATALSLATFVSLRFSPMSEPYTARNVAPAVREDPRYTKVNREITLSWAVGSLLVAVACGLPDVMGGPIALTFLDWVTPLLLFGGTLLWASRRWELFRLALDSTASGAPVRPPAPHFGQLREPAATRRDQQLDGGAGAVIHPFPARRARHL